MKILRFGFCRLTLIMLALSCLPLSNAFAANDFSLEAISATKWAEQNSQFKPYVGIMDGKNEAICGRANNMCNLDSNKCIRCNVRIFQYNMGGLWNDKVGDHYLHFCIGKNDSIGAFADKNSKKNSDYRVSYRDCTEALGRANFDQWNGLGEDGVTSEAMVLAFGAAAGTILPGVGTVAGMVAGEVARAGTSLLTAWAVSDTEWLVQTEEICGTGSDGKKYCLEGLGGEITVVYGKADTITNKCEILPVKLHNMRKCFFCPLFTVIYDASGMITAISFTKLAAAFATLIALGLAIWIAFQTLTHVSSLTKQDAPKFLAGLIKQSYKFLIAFLLLQNGTEVFNHIIEPVLEAGIDFGSEFSTSYQASESTLEDINKEIGLRSDMLRRESLRYYSKDLYEKLDRYVGDLQREISFMQAVGTSLICVGNRGMFDTDVATKFSNGFKMFIQGVVIAAFAFLLSIAFAFYMIDAVVQLGIVGALTPFLVASWPFKATSQYTSSGFKMLLNSAFIFVFIGLAVSVNLNLISASLSMTGNEEYAKTKSDCAQYMDIKQRCDDNQNEYATRNSGKCSEAKSFLASNKAKCEEAANTRFGGLNDLAQAINAQDEKAINQLTDISGMGFLILIFCCIFGFKFMGQVSSLAGQFSSGGIKPTAPSIATMGASAALSGAKKITKPVREAVGRKAEDAEMAIVGAVAHPIRTAKSIGSGVKSVYNKFRGGSGGGGSGGGGDSDNSDADNIGGGSGGDNGGSGGETKATAKSSAKKKGAVVGQNGSGSKKKGATVGQSGFGGGDSGGSGGNGSTGNNGGGSGGNTEDANPQTETSDTPEVGIKKNNTKKATSKNQRKYKKSKRRESSQSRKRNRVKARKHK